MFLDPTYFEWFRPVFCWNDPQDSVGNSIDLGTVFLYIPPLGCPRKLGSMVRINGLFHILLINGTYWGYITHILTWLFNRDPFNALWNNPHINGIYDILGGLYNPLILTIDPNFQGHPGEASFPLPGSVGVKAVTFWITRIRRRSRRWI